MNKNSQIIIRMTEKEKADLEKAAQKKGENVSRLVRYLIFEYIRQSSKNQ